VEHVVLNALVKRLRPCHLDICGFGNCFAVAFGEGDPPVPQQAKNFRVPVYLFCNLLTYYPHGRGCGVGRGRGVTLGGAVAVAVAVGVAVGEPPGLLGVGVGVGGGVVVGVGVRVGVGVGDDPPPTAARMSTRPQP